jgi:hypothetical protein
MTKRRRKSREGFKYILIFCVLILTAGATFFAMSIIAPAKPTKKVDNSNVLSTAVNNDQNNNDTGRGGSDGGDNPDKTPKQYEDPKPESKDSFNASITKNEVVNGKYMLRVNIYELVNDGSCTLHMETANGDTVDRTAKIVIAGPDSSACEGFDVPTSGISSGAYSFTVVIASSLKTSTVKGTIKI